MSESAGVAAAAPAPESAPVTLDRVMLAMDVVDTLRHQRELVERELDDDRRQREFVARVQAIYESQGIEVPEAVIEEGVRALRENRFVYKPPPRTFAVRVAEIYVERGRWALRAGVAFAVVAVIWAAFAVPAHFRRRGLVDSFAQQVVRIGAAQRDLGEQIGQVRERLTAAVAAGTTPAGQRLCADAETELAGAETVVEAIGAGLAELPAAEAYPDDLVRGNDGVAGLDEKVAAARAAVGTARGLLGAVRQLGTLQVRLGTALARLEGIELTGSEQADIDALRHSVTAAIDDGDSDAGQAAFTALDARIDAIVVSRREQAELRTRFRGLATALDGVDVEVGALRELDQLRTTIEQAMAAGDWARVRQQLGPLDALVGELDRSYELRIVSRPGDQSGVWRYRDDNRRQRNYYVIVEAVGADGKVLRLPVTSEEDQKTRSVTRFAIRVPEDVYERVKADKLDNGLIDNVLFGTKRRGARQPEYRFQVAGGRITEW